MLSAFSTMAQRLKYNQNKSKAWYLYEEDAGVAATLMGFIIMYNTLIPLSLYVTMEIIKVMQLCFLQFDIDMYDPKQIRQQMPRLQPFWKNWDKCHTFSVIKRVL